MKLKIYALSGSKADALQAFIRPEVWASSQREQYWYLAAVDEENSSMIGAAVIDPVRPEAELLSIGVSPQYQHRGVATCMLDRAIDLLAQEKVTGLRAIFAMPSDQWSALDGLLRFNAFELEAESVKNYVVPLEQLLQHPHLSTRPQNPHVVSLSSLSAAERSGMAALLHQLKTSPSVLQECEPSCSFVHRSEKGIDAMFLLGKLPNGSLNNLWTWVSAQSGSSRGLVELFACAFHKAAESFPPETKVVFACLNDSSEKLLHHFLPDLEPAGAARSYFTLTEYDNGEKSAEADTGFTPVAEEAVAAPEDPAWTALINSVTLRMVSDETV